jgi:hypothetical protein
VFSVGGNMAVSEQIPLPIAIPLNHIEMICDNESDDCLVFINIWA